MSEASSAEAMRASDLFVQIMYKTLSQHLIAELTDEKVSLPQVHAMRYVWLHQNVLMGDLAAGLRISYPSATNMVKRLERQGLVERMVNPADRREVEVRLTVRGRDLTELMESERISRLRTVLDAMPDEDRAALLRGLYRFVQVAVGEDEDIASDVCLRCGASAAPGCPIAESHVLHVCR
ncbi:MAG: winged helix-turn-helix transcriptional regulator [Chthonomonadales bacterium]|nr:winged helix-turn-helix transcriptional regulator [Chthonomonadales bacterium]